MSHYVYPNAICDFVYERKPKPMKVMTYKERVVCQNNNMKM